MKHEFYDNDFEHFLKDATEDFRMHPSRKVWHSIYNDRHPARKWPSLAVCFLLITTILFVGISNNNSINFSARKNAEKNELLAANLESTKQNKLSAAPNAGEKVLAGETDVDARSIAPTKAVNSPGEISTQTLNPSNNNKSSSSLDIVRSTIFAPDQDEYELPVSGSFKHKSQSTNKRVLAEIPSTVAANKPVLISGEENIGLEQEGTIANGKIAANNIVSSVPNSTSASKPDIALTTANNDEKSWIENYAFQHQAILKKLKSKSLFQFYITPSVGFRQLILNNSDHAAILSTDPAPALYAGYNNKFFQSPAINIEAGGAIIYSLSKKIRLKAGVQFNYTDYITNALNIGHPIQASLALNNPDYSSIRLEQRSTSLLNGNENQNNSKLHNTTLQLSAPVGIDYKIAGSNRLKWYVGGTIQPTLVSPTKVYAISADGKSYIEAPSLVRSWNINSSVETFISYQMSSGVMLNVGPQIRYQLLSTYTEQSIYTERLYNIGVKLGITTRF